MERSTYNKLNATAAKSIKSRSLGGKTPRQHGLIRSSAVVQLLGFVVAMRQQECSPASACGRGWTRADKRSTGATQKMR
jgi:hypothetical protein